MTPPQRVRPRSRTARAQQNGLIDQRPGWAQWFRRQTIQEPFFSVQSSFSSGESPLASVQPFGESRSQLSLSIFPSPPPQRSSQRAHSSNVRSLLEHSGSSEILMYGDENRGSYTPGVVCPTTNVPPNYHEIALPCSAYPGPSLSLGCPRQLCWTRRSILLISEKSALPAQSKSSSKVCMLVVPICAQGTSRSHIPELIVEPKDYHSTYGQAKSPRKWSAKHH
ncbi:hypothetical protein KEM48_004496 [Puccinia striiformis f. sp. tritici PST-130]|nr:hypothetical protein KEM48_004496 [Puccinia striiformis f. sp. tritici PST-130]